ncbi:hypothetical protein UA08_07032 [Talaromyces atroroseus]|uniref:Uncharacterized protein n=1 Tax=Talaromyces atroroseus TaxID=1441469 RepID=A0A225ARH5_TALAT|nr:hypothetical protein UA08_07032 [Talaromyces atroroseus]OKL57546.1 hypothetical protein UA08_07032 [Talaromyces atroroseus]
MTTLLFLGLCFATRVTSVPTANAVEARDDNSVFSDTWTTPAFIACLQNRFPNFPDGVTGSTDINDCRNSIGKRDIDAALDPSDIVGELSTRDTNDELDSHDIVGELAERGLDNKFRTRASLTDLIPDFQAETPTCPEKSLPKNFEEAAPMRAKAQELCKQIGSNLLSQGYALLSETLPDAFTKKDIWLYGNQKVVLELVLSFTPQGRAAMTAAKVSQDTAVSVCTAALTMLATKGEGCTKDIHFSKDFIFKTEQTTGVTDGIMDLWFKKSPIGFISTSFTILRAFAGSTDADEYQDKLMNDQGKRLV